ncbi:zinc metallopeptidase, partial [Myxococcota bacterium]|nr:zinc metallopeptidase [Myxococcota bacterium]MBU1537273.1 zinc metallopeptidase [Myxococcota bacterium]
MILDPLYFLIAAPGLLLALYASYKVKSTFSRYERISLSRPMSGAEVARELLRREGIHDVRVEPHDGFLTDHYDPADRVVRLSSPVYSGRSVSAVGVAAHEVGHAIQHARGYAPMRLRQELVGPANLGSNFAYIAIIVGFLLHSAVMVWGGIILFSAVVAFQAVTFPVEWDASRRAKLQLVQTGIVNQRESLGVARVLNAAALTYFA